MARFYLDVLGLAILKADCNEPLFAPGSDCEISKALFSDIELSSSSSSCVSFFDSLLQVFVHFLIFRSILEVSIKDYRPEPDLQGQGHTVKNKSETRRNSNFLLRIIEIIFQFIINLTRPERHQLKQIR